jgi:putative Holliday junction resolvase
MAICLGFDFGVKKIGIAVGDTETNLANPLATVKAVNQKPDWTVLSKLARPCWSTF